MPVRSSEATWRGNVRDGDGEMALGSGAWRGGYTFRYRFEDEEPKQSNPEELIVAGPTSADSVAGVDGSVDSRNVRGSDRGREASFVITSPESVTITGFSVETQNGLEGRPFVDRDTQFGGDTLPVTFSGDLAVALRDIDASGDLGISAFVEPTSPDADIVVTLEFADGSTRTLGLG